MPLTSVQDKIGFKRVTFTYIIKHLCVQPLNSTTEYPKRRTTASPPSHSLTRDPRALGDEATSA